jgi:N-acyl-L-homoserine lactone synthetase
MTVRVREARTSAELDAVFRLRHQVFVEEEQYMPARHDRRLADRFDAYPTSANIVALVDGRIVGSIRFMERSAAGLSTDEFYDFTEHFAPSATDGCSGMLVVARDYRSTPRLVVSMMAMGYLWAASRGLTRLLGAINPERLDAFRATGYRQVAPQFHHDLRGLDVIPMVLEMSSISPQYARFIRRHASGDSPCPGERQFHGPDELVITPSQRDDVVFRIVCGHVAVIRPGGHIVRQLGPGDTIGRQTMWCSRQQVARVVALDDLDLAVIHPDPVAGPDRLLVVEQALDDASGAAGDAAVVLAQA